MAEIETEETAKIGFVEIYKADPTSDPRGNTPRYYVPTPEEIAAECRKIREGWSSEERERRGPRLKGQC